LTSLPPDGRANSARLIVAAAVVLVAAATLPVVAALVGSGSVDPEAYVDPLVGTANTTTQTGTAGIGSAGLLGQAFPGASRPFGMLQWSPDTNIDRDPISSYVYNGGETRLAGFSLVHNSGVQFRYVPFLPLTGSVTTSPAIDPERYYDRFVHRDERASPGYYRVRLTSGIVAELTTTMRGGLARFRYPHGAARGMLFSPSDTAQGGMNLFRVYPADRRVEGFATANGVRVYFVARFDQPIRGYGTYAGSAVRPGVGQVMGPGTGGWVSFGSGTGTVQAQVAISYVDDAGAAANLAVEITRPRLGFSQAVRAARAAWDRVLGRFEVAETPLSTTRTFFTALYHAVLQPNLAGDADGRYRGWDGEVRRSPSGRRLYTTFSSWDMARSQLPFLAVFFPRETADMMASLVDAYEQTGGWAHRMVTGTRVEDTNAGDWALPAMAFLWGVRGFDANAALGVAIHTATEPAGNPVRPGLSFYGERGWVPDRYLFSAEATLDDASTDFVVGRFAAALGDEETARQLDLRSADWHNVFSSLLSAGAAKGFVWSRDERGAFSPGWSPGAGDCYGPFVEGTSAQYSFSALTDIAGAVAGMGGPGEAVQRLDDLLRRLNDGCLSTDAFLGNEPDFHLPWLYDWAGAPSRSQAAVRRVVNELFSDTPAGLPGNDDWGAMSTYYLWCALGMYPVVPGVPGVALGSPSLGRVTIKLEDGATVRIISGPPHPDRPYIRSLTVNGRPYNGPWLPWAALVDGGTLRLDLGPQPTSWASRPPPTQVPPSFP
jgi:predicted alpha-1,2-mannosidase